MPPRLPGAEPAPDPFDRSIDGFASFSDRLVSIDPFPLEEIRAAVERFSREVSDHCTRASRPAEVGESGEAAYLRLRISEDHRWFRTSVEQLQWFFAVVAREDHGGHRQALGQYGRLLTEALRRHRVDERRREQLVAR